MYGSSLNLDDSVVPQGVGECILFYLTLKYYLHQPCRFPPLVVVYLSWQHWLVLLSIIKMKHVHRNNIYTNVFLYNFGTGNGGKLIFKWNHVITNWCYNVLIILWLTDLNLEIRAWVFYTAIKVQSLSQNLFLIYYWYNGNAWGFAAVSLLAD